MKKVIILSAASIATTFSACNGNSSNKSATADTTVIKPAMDTTAAKPAMDTMKSNMMASLKYTCPMHPEVISDTPGKCPKCGMTMVEIKSGTMKGHMSMKHDSTMKMN
jgi:hypothetical protein